MTVNLVRSDSLYKGVPYAYASMASRLADLHRRSMPLEPCQRTGGRAGIDPDGGSTGASTGTVSG